MIRNFSLFNGGSEDFNHPQSKPKAASESEVTIIFHSQDTMLTKDEMPSSNLGIVKGYMTNEFSYSTNGNYKNVWETSFPDNILTRIASDETQRNLFNYGYATKKMFVQGESPIINIDMMVYSGDDDNMNVDTGSKDNHPVLIAQILTNATLPKVSSNNAFLATNISDQVSNSVKVFYEAGRLAGSIVDTATSLSTEPMVKQLKESANTFSSEKPPVCLLQIGKIFKKDMMVLKRVETTFSKEFIAPGKPLYAKFSMSFESLFNAANIYDAGTSEDEHKNLIFGTGFLLKSDVRKRVSFTSPNNVTQEQKVVDKLTKVENTYNIYYDPKAFLQDTTPPMLPPPMLPYRRK